MTISVSGGSTGAAELLARWDAQQTAFIKHRALRFEAIVQTIQHVQPKAPRVLDLACGPGSMSKAILEAIPDAEIIAIDKDPLLLEIAKEIFADNDKVSVRDADLDSANWADGIFGPFDAVVSTTALHWLKPDVLARLYFELAGMVREGGAFLNGDHLYYDAIAQPTFDRMAKQDDADNQKQAFGSGTDDWDQWWALAEAEPAYATAVAERHKRWEGSAPGPKVTLGYHLETLRSAGFAETGTVWQCLDDYVVCAIR